MLVYVHVYICISSDMMQTKITFEPLLMKHSWISSNIVLRYMCVHCVYIDVHVHVYMCIYW